MKGIQGKTTQAQGVILQPLKKTLLESGDLYSAFLSPKGQILYQNVILQVLEIMMFLITLQEFGIQWEEEI